jgi:DNA-binding response OmpR family regulator
MPKILLVEDDPNLGMLLQEYLSLKGYDAHLATNGDEGLSLFLKHNYDICIFDVMMPKKDGFTLAKEVRSTNSSVPIIFLTAKSQKDDTLQGFRLGADDYMTKPFSMEELLARILAILKRSNQSPAAASPSKYSFGGFDFDTTRQQLNHRNGSSHKLTGKESELLRMLCEHIGQPLSRSVALKSIWGDDSYFNARSMDVYVTKLRKFLKADPNIQIINLHGEGFKLVVD